MSLNVYLILNTLGNIASEPVILVREDGQIKEISEGEWAARLVEDSEIIRQAVSAEISLEFKRSQESSYNLLKMALENKQ